MGWAPILAHFKEMGKDRSYDCFLEIGWEATGGNVEYFLDWQVDNIEDWAIAYAFNNRLTLYCSACNRYSVHCECEVGSACGILEMGGVGAPAMANQSGEQQGRQRIRDGRLEASMANQSGTQTSKVDELLAELVEDIFNSVELDYQANYGLRELHMLPDDPHWHSHLYKYLNETGMPLQQYLQDEVSKEEEPEVPWALSGHEDRLEELVKAIHET